MQDLKAEVGEHGKSMILFHINIQYYYYGND